MENEDKKPKDEETEGQEPEKPETDDADSKEDAPEEDDVKDSHGQPGINKERHDKEVAALNAQIAELKAKVEENAKTEEGRQQLAKEIEDLKAKMADNEVTHKLEMAGCRSVKAAKALLDDSDNDIEKLKEAEPWLFSQEEPAKKGSTGGKPSGATDAEINEQAEAYRRLGVKPPNKE